MRCRRPCAAPAPTSTAWPSSTGWSWSGSRRARRSPARRRHGREGAAPPVRQWSGRTWRIRRLRRGRRSGVCDAGQWARRSPWPMFLQSLRRPRDGRESQSMPACSQRWHLCCLGGRSLLSRGQRMQCNRAWCRQNQHCSAWQITTTAVFPVHVLKPQTVTGHWLRPTRPWLRIAPRGWGAFAQRPRTSSQTLRSTGEPCGGGWRGWRPRCPLCCPGRPARACLMLPP
mmetsp:Transcript_123455/g.343915  ORF Transcript_123455/g.343915 Transcript_123455/m.343915 type:complete len:228 (-) Transcript_123455:1513-2196(-)